MLRNEVTGQIWELPQDRHFTLGQHAECDLVLVGAGVGGWHCALRHAPLAVSIVDLKSSGGTWLNHRPLKRAVMDASCALSLGSSHPEKGCVLNLELNEAPRLDVICKGERTLSRALDREVMVVGRASGCDVGAPSERVSRKHLRLSVVQDGVIIQDFNSSRGTRVCGQDIQSALLVPGDEIEVGGERFTFLDARSPSQPPEELWRLMTTEGIVPLSKSTITVGRSSECDLVVEGCPHVSRQHARFVWDKALGLCVYDLSSISGTVVNGRLVDRAQLKGEDLVQIGRWRAFVVPPGR